MIPRDVRIAALHDRRNSARLIDMAIAAATRVGLDIRAFDTITAAEAWLLT